MTTTPEDPDEPLAVGDWIEKATGYRIFGEIRSVFAMRDSGRRYAVEIAAAGGGSFVHIYGRRQLRRLPRIAARFRDRTPGGLLLLDDPEPIEALLARGLRLEGGVLVEGVAGLVPLESGGTLVDHGGTRTVAIVRHFGAAGPELEPIWADGVASNEIWSRDAIADITVTRGEDDDAAPA